MSDISAVNPYGMIERCYGSVRAVEAANREVLEQKSDCPLCHIKQWHSLKNQYLLMFITARKMQSNICMKSSMMDVVTITHLVIQ